MKSYEELQQSIITKKLSAKAEELGIDFKVKVSMKQYGPDHLIRIKNNGIETGKIKEFTNHVHNIVVPAYANGVRFSYPKKL